MKDFTTIDLEHITEAEAKAFEVRFDEIIHAEPKTIDDMIAALDKFRAIMVEARDLNASRKV